MKVLKSTSAVSTTDGWLKLNFASCVVRETRSLGARVLRSICNMVFANYIYDMVFARKQTTRNSTQPNSRGAAQYHRVRQYSERLMFTSVWTGITFPVTVDVCCVGYHTAWTAQSFFWAYTKLYTSTYCPPPKYIYIFFFNLKDAQPEGLS